MNLSTVQNQSIESTELFVKLNEFREEADQKPIRYNDFMARVADELDSSDYEIIVVQNTNNTHTKVAKLDKDQCLLVGMRESKAVRKSVLKWIKELEDKQPSWIANLSPQATIAIEDMNRQIETLADKVAEDAPKVELFNKIVDHGESKCFRDVAAHIGVKQGYFTSVLQAKKIIYKKGGEYRAYSEFAKYFDLKTGLNNYTDKDGNAQSKEYNQLRVNTEGLDYLIKRFANPELKALGAK